MTLKKIPGSDNSENTVRRQSQAASQVCQRMIPYIRLGIICLAVLLIIVGIFNGSMSDVLHKAIRICTECIGLG